MKILAIESSCDETAAAVVQEGVILSNVVATQMKVHAEYGGVVPELAAREHLSNVLPVVNQALSDAGMSAKNLAWIAATRDRACLQRSWWLSGSPAHGLRTGDALLG